MTRIDVLCGEPHFADHLAPVYLALPDDRRGDFIVRRSSQADVPALRARAALRGIDTVSVLSERHPGRVDRPVLVASWSDMKAAEDRHSPIARMEHGIGQSFAGYAHPSYAGGRGADAVGLFLTPNEHSADRWRRAYPRASVAVVGCPKLDTLPAREPGPGPVIALSFHWGNGVWRSSLPEVNGSFSEYAAVLGKVAREFTVIGHGHPRALDKMTRAYRRAGIETVPDFADVLRRADVYVCDTNSTIYEFASTGRPTVVVNGRHFRRNVRHGLRFDWGTVTNVGVQCDSPADLIPAIREALLDRPAQRAKREAALDVVYQPRSGGAALAAAALVEWADGLAAQAA